MIHQFPRRLAETFLALTIGFGCLPPALMPADETPIATIEHPNPVDFQRELLPILRKKCLACHNGTDAESDLILETPETILKGGSQGPAVVAGQPDESLMLILAAGRDEPVMPPEDNSAGAALMTAEELALLKLWIEQGAEGQITAAIEPIHWKPLPAGVNPVYAVAQSPNGRFIAAGRANQAWIYDVLLGQYVDRLIDPSLADSPVANGDSLAHLDLVQSLAFSHDGQWIASGGYRTVKLWQRVPSVGPAHQLPLSRMTLATRMADGGVACADEAGAIHRLAVASAEPVAVLTGHAGPVLSLTGSPNGNWLASCGEDNTVRIWNQQHAAADAQTQTARVRRLAWVNESTLVGAGDDHVVRVWSVSENGQLGEPRQLAGHAQPVTAVARLGTDRIISAAQDGNIRLWVLDSGETQREFNHGAAVSDLAVAAEANRLVTVGGDAVAKLWDLESGKLISELAVDPQLQWQRDQQLLGQQVAKRHVDNLNQDLEAAKKRVTEEDESLKKTQEAHTKATEDLAKAKEQAEAATTERQAAEKTVAEAKDKLAAAEKALADASDDAVKQQANEQIEQAKNQLAAAEGELKPKVEAADKASSNMAESEKALDSARRSVETSEKALADAKSSAEQLEPQLQTAAQRLEAAEQQLKQAVELLQMGPHHATRVSMADDGKLIATCDAQGHVIVWRSQDGKALQAFAPPDGPVVAMEFTHDGTLHAATADAKVFGLEYQGRWRLARTIGAPDETSTLKDRVTALSFSPDDQQLAIGGGEPSRGGELKIFAVHDGALVREIVDAHSDTIFGLAFSPDGQQLASCGADRFMKVFDVATAKLLRTFEGHTHHVLSVAWRADGRVLATGGADKVVKLWNVIDGSQIRTIQGFGKEVTSLQFAGAEDRFFAACGDQNLYRCDMGGDRKSISSGQDFLYVVSTSLLGNSVAFGGHDSIVRVVDGDGGQLAELMPSNP